MTFELRPRLAFASTRLVSAALMAAGWLFVVHVTGELANMANATDTLDFTVNGVQYDLTLNMSGAAATGTVSSVSGTVGGVAITGLDATYDGADNTVHTTSAPYVGYAGISFDVGSTQYNLSGQGGDYLTDAANPNGVLATNVIFSSTACYCLGTRILCADGEAEVEKLRIGDLVVTASGVARPIKWIGRRAYSARFVRNNPQLRPIRIRAGALGPSIPSRDLLISPRHAMFILGALVEAEHLVNGSSIVTDNAAGDVQYFHVELETHDVLIANGAPSESFVDDDSRAMFQNAQTFAEAYPDHKPGSAVYCAPRITKNVPLFDKVRALISAHATRAAEVSAA